jgi:hypothetical protein
MAAPSESRQRGVEQSPIRRASAERDRARKARNLAARDLHDAYLYGGRLEQQRRDSAEQHLAAARRHEEVAAELERAAQTLTTSTPPGPGGTERSAAGRERVPPGSSR